MQGGNLLRISTSDAPIGTIMPILGGWAVLAVLLSRQKNHLAESATGAGRLLAPSLITLALLIVLTGLAQVWRSGGQTLTPQELMTVAQLGVLTALSAYLLHNPHRVMLVGYVTVALGVVLSILALMSQAGVAPSIFGVQDYGEYSRASGLVGDPNYFSFQLLLSLAFAANIGLVSRKTYNRLWAWPAFVIILAGIISTYSGGALVGVVAVLGGTILLQLQVSAKRAIVAFGVIALATALVAVLAPADYGKAVQEKYSGLTESSFEEFGTGRGAAWQAAGRAIADNPILGVGLGGPRVQAAIAEHYRSSTVERISAHNMYLGIGVGTGVIGLAVFLMTLASSFSVLWTTHLRAAVGGQSEALLASACLFTALLVVATQGLTLTLEYEKFVWLLIGACLAVRHWPRERVDGSDSLSGVPQMTPRLEP
jgi:O-antigen ligase